MRGEAEISRSIKAKRRDSDAVWRVATDGDAKGWRRSWSTNISVVGCTDHFFFYFVWVSFCVGIFPPRSHRLCSLSLQQEYTTIVMCRRRLFCSGRSYVPGVSLPETLTHLRVMFRSILNEHKNMSDTTAKRWDEKKSENSRTTFVIITR